MNILRLPLLFIIFCCSCNESKRIEAYQGKWQSLPFGEVMEQAFVEEIIPAMRDGSFLELEEMAKKDPKAMVELLKKSDEEIKKEMMPMMMFANFDIRVAFTISKDFRFISSVITNGEETVLSNEEAEFEVTHREILVRTEDETEILYIEDDHLKMRNEDRGKYPRFFKFYRVEVNSGP